MPFSPFTIFLKTRNRKNRTCFLFLPEKRLQGLYQGLLELFPEIRIKRIGLKQKIQHVLYNCVINFMEMYKNKLLCQGRKKDRNYTFHDTCFGLPRLEPLTSCTKSLRLHKLKRIRKLLYLRHYLKILKQGD